MIWLDLMTCSKILLHPPLIYPVASLKANIPDKPCGLLWARLQGTTLGALSYSSHLFSRSQSRKKAKLPELKRKCWNMQFWWRESPKPSYGSKGCHGAVGIPQMDGLRWTRGDGQLENQEKETCKRQGVGSNCGKPLNLNSLTFCHVAMTLNCLRTRCALYTSP